MPPNENDKNSRRRRRRGRALSQERETTTTLDSSGVGLNLGKLEELLCKTIQTYCRNYDTGRYYRRRFKGISERDTLTRTQFDDIVSILLDVLNRSPTMPCTLIAYIHSNIGLLYMSQSETRLAIQSFTKSSLWIQTSINVTPAEAGLTLHRLAVCHAMLGDAKQAQSLLKKALKLYGGSKRKNNIQVSHAQEELDRLEAMNQKRNLRRKSNEGLCLKLTTVLELEDE